MTKSKLIALTVLVSLLLAFVFYKDKPAVKFLKALNKEQRAQAQLTFEDQSKFKWHYIPSSMYPRAGIQLAELDENQKGLLHDFLKTSLSETGYAKTIKIIGLENVLLELTGDSVMRDTEKYSVAFYGNPEVDSLWAWSFGGHHLSLNFTVLNGVASIAPRFLGANPAMILSGSRKGERVLEKEEDLGFSLINALNEEQKGIAIFRQKAFNDIVTRNSEEVEPLEKVGIKFEKLDKSQQLIFLKIIEEYLSTLPEAQASEKMGSIKKEEVNELSFAWAGATVPGLGHYYRIQGKTFLIEFDNTQGNANHIHTVWRDFDGDFGRDLIREHYKNSDHHKH